MKRKLFNLFFICTILGSFILNFNSFLMGSPSKWFNTAVSILFAVSGYIFILLSKKDKVKLVFSIVWGVFTLMCSAVTLIVNINENITADFFIPAVIVFLTPLYGMESFFSQARFLMASMVNIIISIGWIIVGFIFMKRINKYGKPPQTPTCIASRTLLVGFGLLFSSHPQNRPGVSLHKGGGKILMR